MVVAVIDPSLRPIVSFAILGTLLTMGHALRARIRMLRVLSLPASCVGGIVGLIARQLLLRTSVSVGQFLDRELIAGWTDLPSLLTNIVFVTLVLGEPLPSPTQLWRLSGPQLAFGQLLAFGQYTVCAFMVAVWLGPMYGVPRLFAAIVPLGFEGGHGVVAGNRAALERYDYPQGVSLGYVAATIGLLVGTLLGCTLANWARWRGLLASVRVQDEQRHQDAAAEDNGVIDIAEGSILEAAADADSSDSDFYGIRAGGSFVPREPPEHEARQDLEPAALPPASGFQTSTTKAHNPAPSHADFDGCYPSGSSDRPRLGTCVVAVSSLDSLAHHLSIVGVTLSCAWCAKLGVSALSELRLGGGPLVAPLRAIGRFLDPLPLFLYALLCAVCVQAMMDRSKRCKALLPLDRDTAASICATAQDFLIASAVCVHCLLVHA